MDDVDDDAFMPPSNENETDSVAELTTEDLRREVERLKSLLTVGGSDESSSDDDGRRAVALISQPHEEDEDEEEFDQFDPRSITPYDPDATLKYSNGDVYKGEAIDNVRNGRGTHQCSNGDFYEGQWKDDKRHGEGKLTYVSGLQYEGSWIDDTANGHGTCRYPNGDVYEGEWRNDHRWGWGKLVFASGDVYEGEWVDDAVEGAGRYSYADKSYFQGSFLRGMREKGKFVSADGSVEYDGEWRDGARHGRGVFHLAGVYEYVGEWRDDARHGQGRCTYADGTWYDGEWKNDERDGNGTFGDKEESYEGGWRRNAKEGFGTSKFADGGRYQGEWKEGLEEGNGKRLYPDGSMYEGQWSKGKRHGKGRCSVPSSKEVYQGEWANDERHGYGVCEYADSSKFRGEWEEGCWLQSTADPTFTRVHGSGLSRGIVGEPATFRIEARDELKNKRMNGGDDFYVRFENDATGEVAFATVSDADDGTYAVKFITTAAGNYTCSVLIGADEHVADSPYPVRILPGRPSPRRCGISGEGHRKATVGAEAFFFVDAIDRHGNAAQGKIGAHLPVEVTIASHDDMIEGVRVDDTGNGQLRVSFEPSRPGYYRVAIMSQGIPIGKSPYSLHVRTAEDQSTGAEVPDDVFAAPPPMDKVIAWENIALEEYVFDGDEGGWDSADDEDEETPEERAMRENPDLPVITNLEDLYKIPRLQRLQREEKRKKKAARLEAMRKRFEAEEKASADGNHQAPVDVDGGGSSIADLD